MSLQEGICQLCAIRRAFYGGTRAQDRVASEEDVVLDRLSREAVADVTYDAVDHILGVDALLQLSVDERLKFQVLNVSERFRRDERRSNWAPCYNTTSGIFRRTVYEAERLTIVRLPESPLSTQRAESSRRDVVGAAVPEYIVHRILDPDIPSRLAQHDANLNLVIVVLPLRTFGNVDWLFGRSESRSRLVEENPG